MVCVNWSVNEICMPICSRMASIKIFRWPPFLTIGCLIRYVILAYRTFLYHLLEPSQGAVHRQLSYFNWAAFFLESVYELWDTLRRSNFLTLECAEAQYLARMSC